MVRPDESCATRSATGAATSYVREAFTRCSAAVVRDGPQG